VLAINEEFFSIQGEGIHTGVPMYFVRLQGCDVGCYFCDTKYTWKDKSADIYENDIADRAFHLGAKWICITGGEPYEQNLAVLVAVAHDNGLKTQVETSGGAPWQDAKIDWITLSPKDLFTKPDFQTHEEYKERANEIKCVVTKQKDIQYYIDNYYSYCNSKKPLIFQLLDENFGNNVFKINNTLSNQIFDKIKNMEYARCMIQTHKIMEMR